MRVMGIDPGTRVVGYAVVESQGNRITPVAFGAILAKSGADYGVRLRHIYDSLCRLIDEQKPDVAAIEEAFYGKSASSALRMGEGRGVAIVAVASRNRPLFQYSPAEVKKAVVGNGRAHKTQIQEMVRILLGLREVPKPEDAADALAVAICHCNRSRFTVPWPKSETSPERPFLPLRRGSGSDAPEPTPPWRRPSSGPRPRRG